MTPPFFSLRTKRSPHDGTVHFNMSATRPYVRTACGLYGTTATWLTSKAQEMVCEPCRLAHDKAAS